MHYAPTVHKYMSKVLDLIQKPRSVPLASNFVTQRSRSVNPEAFTLLSRLREKLDGSLDQTDITAECLDHMVAGIETTGDALCFLMWELSQPQSIHFQRELRKEMLDNPDVSADKLPFLDAIVQEGLRCFTPIPMSLPRVVPEGGKVIDGIAVPEGSVVSSQAYSVHRQNTDVFPDPDRFDPHRWTSPVGDAERKRHMFAFSHGGRGCVGKQ